MQAIHALELAYLMLQKIADGQSFSALEYHANLATIRAAIGDDRADKIVQIVKDSRKPVRLVCSNKLING